jgi:hypothetical protein
MNSALSRLIREYSIPGWPEPETYIEQVQIGENSHLNLVGLSLQPTGLPEITASAAGLSVEKDKSFDDSLFTRAYFELIERSAILLAEKNDLSGSLFSKSSDEGFWKYSKSNGIAAHIEWDKACYSAVLELIERDAVLRSWYFNSPPMQIKTPPHLLSSPLNGLYEIKVFQFQTPHQFQTEGQVQTEISVIGAFGFPKQNTAPLFFGFGAHKDLSKAIDHAVQEGYQRLGFTWGEAPPEEPLAENPTPFFHLNYYLLPEKMDLIRRWLEGALRSETSFSHSQKKTSEIRFTDLTPASLKGKCFVVKADSDSYMPLTFGKWHPWVGPQLGVDLFPHPIS